MRSPGFVPVLLLLLLLFIAAGTCAAAPLPPHVVSYQGRITDAAGNPISDGPHSVSFVIWGDSISTNVGDVVWSSGPVTVTTAKGLFSVGLGAGPQPALSSSIFQDSARWLGTKVGTDPEISPRSRMVSVPYALTAEYAVTAPNYLPLTGGAMTGSTTHSDVMDTWTSAGNPRVRIGPNSGYIVLNNDQVTNPMTAALIAVGGSGLGGALWLGDYQGTEKVYFDAGNTSTSSVQLPDGAIDAHEILDEPGIVSNFGPNVYGLTVTMQDLATASITIPAAGYISLSGATTITYAGTTGNNSGFLQIDETAGGSPVFPYAAIYGMESAPNTSTSFVPVSARRIYFKPAGTYTFRLEACAWNGNGSGATQDANFPYLTAYYFPTSYGSVTAIAGTDEVQPFNSSESVTVTDPAGGASQSMKRVDLRELELKAAKTRADAETAARKLAEAKLAQRINQDRQSAR